jgi:hypothetical protein
MKRTLLVVCVLAICNLMLFAQDGKGPRIVRTTEKSAVHVPAQEFPATLTRIYNNLGTKTDLYYDGTGWGIGGPNGPYRPGSFALAFTPKSDSHILAVGAALQYESGANQVNLSIYADSAGVPGTLLAGPVTVVDLPSVATCCSLAVVRFPSVAVSGGIQYWVVADTPLTGTGSDFEGAWDLVAHPTYPQAANTGDGWYGWTGRPSLPAGEVLGTVP